MTYSTSCLEVLRLLRDRHNVLIAGPPGTGKSLLLNEVARAFLGEDNSIPVHVPDSPIAIPESAPSDQLLDCLPAPDQTARKVFRTVFHQNSKHRDFITGLSPVVGTGNANAGAFEVTKGTLYRAAENARVLEGSSLVIIDEINRGPAVQVFGGSIVAIESDKRLNSDGTPSGSTQFFELMNPEDGKAIEYALPQHLYLLAALNQADTSVEPLDVAFLRRWSPYRLEPSEDVLLAYFGLSKASLENLPQNPESASSVFAAATKAWSRVNERITLGRGEEYRIGHGVLMTANPGASTVQNALGEVSECWKVIRAHVDEVFFGDIRGVAAVLNVGVANHPYSIADALFADEPRTRLDAPQLPPELLYRLLISVGA